MRATATVYQDRSTNVDLVGCHWQKRAPWTRNGVLAQPRRAAHGG